MRTLKSAFLCAALPWALALPASTQENVIVTGRTADETCLSRANIDTVRIIDNHRILFATHDQRLYRNDLMKICPALRATSQVSYTMTANNQLCAGSSFQVLIRVSSSGNTTSVYDAAKGTSTAVEGPGLIGGPVCRLGMFTAVGAEEAAALIVESQKKPPTRRERRAAREAAENEAANDAAPEAADEQ